MKESPCRAGALRGTKGDTFPSCRKITQGTCAFCNSHCLNTNAYTGDTHVYTSQQVKGVCEHLFVARLTFCSGHCSKPASELFQIDLFGNSRFTHIVSHVSRISVFSLLPEGVFWLEKLMFPALPQADVVCCETKLVAVIISRKNIAATLLGFFLSLEYSCFVC